MRRASSSIYDGFSSLHGQIVRAAPRGELPATLGPAQCETMARHGFVMGPTDERVQWGGNAFHYGRAQLQGAHGALALFKNGFRMVRRDGEVRGKPMGRETGELVDREVGWFAQRAAERPLVYGLDRFGYDVVPMHPEADEEWRRRAGAVHPLTLKVLRAIERENLEPVGAQVLVWSQSLRLATPIDLLVRSRLAPDVFYVLELKVMRADTVHAAPSEGAVMGYPFGMLPNTPLSHAHVQAALGAMLLVSTANTGPRARRGAQSLYNAKRVLKGVPRVGTCVLTVNYGQGARLHWPPEEMCTPEVRAQMRRIVKDPVGSGARPTADKRKIAKAKGRAAKRVRRQKKQN